MHSHLCSNRGIVIETSSEFDCAWERDHDDRLCDDCAKTEEAELEEEIVEAALPW